MVEEEREMDKQEIRSVKVKVKIVRGVVMLVTTPWHADIIMLGNVHRQFPFLHNHNHKLTKAQPCPLLPLLANSESAFGSMLGVPLALE